MLSYNYVLTSMDTWDALTLQREDTHTLAWDVLLGVLVGNIESSNCT